MELFPKEDTPQEKVPEQPHEKNHTGKLKCFQMNVSVLSHTFCLTGVTAKILFNHCSDEIIIVKDTKPKTT